MSLRRFVWLASYPKSGNTWVRMLLESLTRNGEEPAINEMALRSPVITYADLQAALGIEASELTMDEIGIARPFFYRQAARRAVEPLLFRKVHDCYWKNSEGEPVYPPDVSAAIIYIIRNPSDIAVSAASFFGTSLDRAVDNLCDDGFVLAGDSGRGALQLPQLLRSWSQHVISWTESGLPTIVVRYEDLLIDPAGQLSRITNLLGWSEEHIAAAIESTAFERLAAQEAREGFKENPNTHTKFFRSGRSGEGRRVLSIEQLRRIETSHSIVMRAFGYL